MVDARINAAILSMDLAVEAFEAEMDRVRALDTTVKDADVSKAISRFVGAFNSLVGERLKLYGKVDGRFAAFEPIDVDAARLEIGGLLNRIRTAIGQGRLPEGPE